MGLNKPLDPLAQAVWQLVLALWPLWLLLALYVLGCIAFQVYQQHRLSQAGIAEIDRMDGIAFERYLEVLFRQQSYHTERTPPSGDFGADLILSKDCLRTVVQAKRYTKNVGVKAIQEVVAAQKMYHGAKALVVTNSHYTKAARHLAQVNHVELWDREHLVTMILSIQKSHPSEKSKQIANEN
jgi:restriction system protein